MYLGIDLGTSGVKAVLIDDDQAVVGSGSAALDVSRPRPGWSEQSPGDWLAGVDRAVGALRASRADALAAVRGIGLAGQMHGATLWHSGIGKVANSPITYELDGRQYVVIGGGGVLYAFALPEPP